MAKPKRQYLNAPTGTIVGYDGQDFYPVHVDSEGTLRVNSLLDFAADIEIAGVAVLNRGFTPAAAGSNNLVLASGGERLKVYKVMISPSVDLSGEAYVSLGATKIGSVQNPMSGGQYVLMSAFPNYEHGALGENLTINLPSATAVSVNVSYEVA